MKIIQLIQKPQLRGAEIFACQLSEHLINMGHEVVVVSIFRGDAELPFSGTIVNLNRNLSKRLIDIGGWRKLNNIVRGYEPDIVQANASDTLKFAASSKAIFRWNTRVIFRNANKVGDFIQSKVQLHLNKFYLSKIDHVVSVSQECEKDFKKTFSYPSPKINTIEIGVEEAELGTIPGDLKDIFQKGPVVTHIGGFVPEKNHDGLVRIMDATLKQIPKTQFLLIGKGQLNSQIRDSVSSLKIDSNVHFLNYRSDVLDILYHSKAFVLPSLIEGLPAVILEAMYCGTPVIAYNVGGIGEVVKPGKTGWLIGKNEEEEFQQTLKYVLLNEEISKEVIEARKMIYQKFLNKQIAQRFLELYFSCAN